MVKLARFRPFESFGHVGHNGGRRGVNLILQGKIPAKGGTLGNQIDLTRQMARLLPRDQVLETSDRRTQLTSILPQYSVLSTQYSVLSTQYSVLSTQYSVLSTQYSVLSMARRPTEM